MYNTRDYSITSLTWLFHDHCDQCACSRLSARELVMRRSHVDVDNDKFSSDDDTTVSSNVNTLCRDLLLL